LDLKKELQYKNISCSYHSLKKFFKKHKEVIHIQKETILSEARQFAETKQILPFLLKFFF
jgi:hypothetical protein